MVTDREVREYFLYVFYDCIFTPLIRLLASKWSIMLHQELHNKTDSLMSYCVITSNFRKKLNETYRRTDSSDQCSHRWKNL